MKFTILTAIKDGFSDFRKTIPTVLAQTFGDFEWIVIDDGSSLPLASEFPEFKLDSRVRILRNETSCGQTRSLNSGIEAATGEWIVRMDGDDLCASQRLERIVAAVAAAPKAQILFSDYRVIDGNDRVWAEVEMRQPLSPDFFHYLERINNPICHPTVAFRRLKADGTLRRFREDLINAQDYALWREILQESGPEGFLHLPFPAIDYRIVRNSLSGARAPEQLVERNAIRSGQVLRTGEQSRPTLSERQKDAMQSYRLLYYRFVGRATPAGLADDLNFLISVFYLPRLVPKAALFLFLRPLRKVLLLSLFARIYQ